MFSYQVFIKCLLYVALYELYFEDSNPKVYLKICFIVHEDENLFLFMGVGRDRIALWFSLLVLELTV